MQESLKAKGFFGGICNGEETEEWKRAVVKFKRRYKLRARYFIGPVTKTYVLKGEPIERNDLRLSDPSWLKIAKSYIGIKEIKGRLHNSTVVGFWKKIYSSWFDDDETPWCAAYVGACLEDAGFKSTRSARARSYEDWADGYRLPGPSYGCIVVFSRGKKGSGQGHVGFVVGVDKWNRLMVLGGNQADAVNVKPFDKSRVEGYFWPKGGPTPSGKKLPVLSSDGQRSSSNEA